MAPSKQRADLLRAEIQRLEAEIQVLDRQWSRKHWLGLSVLVVVPMMIFGVAPLWIALAVLAAPCLVATQAYLLWVRRRECRHLIEQAEQDLEWVESGAPPMRASRA